MSGLLPSTSEAEPPETEPRVVGVDDDDADRLLSALSSGTARSVYAALHDSPKTPSEVAAAVDTSLQNAQYHLGKLEDADLIDVHDTRYSAKGREMKVYAPADGPVVLFAGPSDESASVKSMLTSLLGAVGVLGLASLVVQQVFGDGIAAPTVGSSGGADGGAAPETVTESGGAVTAQDTTTTVTQAAYDAATAAEQAAGLPPGLLFFLGGLTVLALGVAYWYVRR